MTPTTKAGRALHADPITRQVASYPHPEGVTDCWLCRHIVLVEREAAAEAEALRAALEDVLRLGHIQDDGPSLCQCRTHQRARAALLTPAPAAPKPCLDCAAPTRDGKHLDDRLDETHTPHVAAAPAEPEAIR